MALRAEVVDLVRLDLRQQRDEPGAVVQVAVVQGQPAGRLVRVLVDVVDALGVERGRAADQPVHLVALREQQLGEVRAVLAGDAGDQSGLGHAESVGRAAGVL